MPKRILVIDSDPSIRRSVLLFLRAERYEVNEARDGKAIDLLDKSRFDLVLSDVRSPRLKGMAVLLHLRSILPDISIILMTGEPYGEILGGEVKVERELGKGSTFIVTLPTRT